MDTVERAVVGAFIFSDDNEILLGKNSGGGIYPGYWLVPGGKIVGSQSPTSAIIQAILNKIGLDIRNATIKPLSTIMTDTTEKTLRDTGEAVEAQLTFFSFEVHLPTQARQTPIHTPDTMSEVAWFELSQIHDLNLAPPTKQILLELGYS